MTIDEIRRIHYTQKGREEEQRELIFKQYSKGLKIEYIAEINDLDIEYVTDVVKASRLW